MGLQARRKARLVIHVLSCALLRQLAACHAALCLFVLLLTVGSFVDNASFPTRSLLSTVYCVASVQIDAITAIGFKMCALPGSNHALVHAL